MILTQRTRQTAALVFALTFQVTAGMDALGLHDCPHHDAIGSGPVQHDGGQAPAGHDHGAHLAPTPNGSSGQNTPTQHSQHTQHGACTCVGSCQLGGNTLGGPAARQQVAPAALVSASRALEPAGDEILPGAPAFFLPFANAPPGLADIRL